MTWIIKNLLSVEHVLNWPSSVLDNFFYCSTGIIFSGVKEFIYDYSDETDPNIHAAIEKLQVYLDGRCSLLESLNNDETRELVHQMRDVNINNFYQDDYDLEDLEKMKKLFEIVESQDEQYNLTFDNNKFNKVIGELSAIADTDDDTTSAAAQECQRIMESNARLFKNGKARLDTYTPLIFLRKNAGRLIPLKYAVDFAIACKEQGLTPKQWRNI